MSMQTQCPACGAPVSFKRESALVVVCQYCHSVVARGDRGPETMGKVADLVDTPTRLSLGLHGRFKSQPFEIVGRCQYRHPAGGVWDEWYAAFDDGRWGWIADAEGRLYLTFEKSHAERETLPPFEDLQPGKLLRFSDLSKDFSVTDYGEATAIAAEGELPFRLAPNRPHKFADLSGPSKLFASIDYDASPPIVYLGSTVTPGTLGIETAELHQPEARAVEGKQLNCPNCGGPLELRAPDQTQRVVCPSCQSLLDANEGNLRYLETLTQQECKPKQRLPLGATGTLFGETWTVIGFMQRSVTFDGVDYYWGEYLLHNPKAGFRWLVHSDYHWSFVEEVPAGDVNMQSQSTIASSSNLKGMKVWHDGKAYKLFQRANATARYIVGEFYWKVTAGETVDAWDFVCPPQMISVEYSRHSVVTSNEGGESVTTRGEVHFSRGTYMPVADVAKAFSAKDLPAPAGVAPNQPFRYKGIYMLWFAMLGFAFAIAGVGVLAVHKQRVFTETFVPTSNATTSDKEVFFSKSFELVGHKNLQVTASASVSNSWVYVDGAVIDDETFDVQPFGLPIEYYFGVDGGESWSEGGTSNYCYLSAPDQGKYTMRLEIQYPPGTPHLPVTVDIDQGIFRWGMWFLTVFLLSIVPGLVAAWNYVFEYTRWKDSEFSPYASSE